MEALSQIFALITDSVPKFCSKICAYFLWFLLTPYPIARLTTRTLRSRNLTTISLVLFVFLAFAIILGIPHSSQLVLGFKGGLAQSLQAIWQLDTKGKDFFYLIIFVLASTVLSLIIAEFVKWLLRRSIPRRLQFLDLFHVFIAFNVGWFLLSSSIFNIVYGAFYKEPLLTIDRIESLRRSYSFINIFDENAIEILMQPAILFSLLAVAYTSRKLFSAWARTESLYSLFSAGKSKEALTIIAHRSLNIIPVVAYACILCSTSVILAYLVHTLYAQVAGDDPLVFSRDASCSVTKSNKLFLNFYISNNTSVAKQLKSVYVSTNGVGRFRFRIDPIDVGWLAEKGLFLEGGEKRYYRLLISSAQLPAAGSEVVCRIQNDKDGDFLPSGSDETASEYVRVSGVEGDTYASKPLLTSEKN